MPSLHLDIQMALAKICLVDLMGFMNRAMGLQLPTIAHLRSQVHRCTGHTHSRYPHGKKSRDRGQSQGARDRGRAGTAGLSPGLGLHSSHPSTWGQ